METPRMHTLAMILRESLTQHCAKFIIYISERSVLAEGESKAPLKGSAIIRGSATNFVLFFVKIIVHLFLLLDRGALKIAILDRE